MAQPCDKDRGIDTSGLEERIEIETRSGDSNRGSCDSKLFASNDGFNSGYNYRRCQFATTSDFEASREEIFFSKDKVHARLLDW